jgi:hypothetical protein
MLNLPLTEFVFFLKDFLKFCCFERGIERHLVYGSLTSFIARKFEITDFYPFLVILKHLTQILEKNRKVAI